MRTHDESINFVTLWTNCILCKTPYMQNMGLAMAKACVKNYECLPDTDAHNPAAAGPPPVRWSTEHEIEQFEMRIISLDFMATINVDLGNHNDALKSYNYLLEIVKIATGLGRDGRLDEAKVLSGMLLVYMKTHRLNDAIAVMERKYELGIDLEGPTSSMARESTQVQARIHRMMGEGCDHKADTAAELVRARQRFKETQNDSNDMDTRLLYHFMLVQALGDDGKTQEAKKQLDNLLSDSRRVLGPDHPVTLQYENRAEDYCTRMNQAAGGVVQKTTVWAVIDYEKKPAIHGRLVRVLKATKKDAGIYICQIYNQNGVLTKVKVVHDQFILDAGTTVVVHGLVASKALNGRTGIIRSFDKEKRRYAVLMGTKEAPVLIKPINLKIAFV